MTYTLDETFAGGKDGGDDGEVLGRGVGTIAHILQHDLHLFLCRQFLKLWRQLGTCKLE